MAATSNSVRLRTAAAAGIGGTIATSAGGVLQPATTQQKTLLGQ